MARYLQTHVQAVLSTRNIDDAHRPANLRVSSGKGYTLQMKVVVVRRTHVLLDPVFATELRRGQLIFFLSHCPVQELKVTIEKGCLHVVHLAWQVTSS